MRLYKQWHILAVYDIKDPDRLRLVAKAMENVGDRVQQSVFELYLLINQLRRQHSAIKKKILAEEDSVRYYLMCEEDFGKRISLGKLKYEARDVNDIDTDYLIV